LDIRYRLKEMRRKMVKTMKPTMEKTAIGARLAIRSGSAF
jgi:hypothetical protein